MKTGAQALVVVMASLGQMASAQSFFGSIGVESAVGLERGSTVELEPVDRPTRYLTVDTYGSQDVGPVVGSASLSLPHVLRRQDQLDLNLVVAGPGERITRELTAFGIGYRYRFDSGLTVYSAASFAKVTSDGPMTRQLDIEAKQTSLAFGVRRDHDLGGTRRVRWNAEIRARDSTGTSRGIRLLEERLWIAFASIRYDAGAITDRRVRFGAAVALGIDGPGRSMTPNPLGSVPGAAADFTRVSLSAEMSQPLSVRWAINAGLVGQWSADVLPISQRCGFSTNSYSRGFDVSGVTGDQCLGGRVELAHNLTLPAPGATWLQGYAGIDAGRIRLNAVGGTTDGWSSLSVGVRGLAGDLIAEATLTQTLDRPAVTGENDGPRLWARAALRF